MNAEQIEAEYQRRIAAHPSARWGWSFMYTPEATLDRARMVLIGLNPGGSQLDPPNEWDYSAGENAYVDESWRDLPAGEHHLQQQVRALFDAAGVPGRDVFAANLVPFRSPSWDRLPDRDGALVFGRALWSELLARTPARLFVSLGKRAGVEIASLIGAPLRDPVSAGWGAQTIDRYEADDGRLVLALPHLSRFKLFGGGRTAAADEVRRAASRTL